MQDVLTTERLVLRPRTEADLDDVVALNSDPEVMRYLAPIGDPSMGREALAARSFRHAGRGLGYWGVFPKAEPDRFLGYVGLIEGMSIADGVELSYRFHTAVWGKGIAHEAASRLVRHGLEVLQVAEIFIVTHPGNAPSMALAQRLGFVRQADRRAKMMGDPDFLCAVFAVKRTS